jgi:hypothetical protein
MTTVRCSSTSYCCMHPLQPCTRLWPVSCRECKPSRVIGRHVFEFFHIDCRSCTQRCQVKEPRYGGTVMGPRRMFVGKESKSVQSQILIEIRSIAKANQGTSTGESILAIYSISMNSQVLFPVEVLYCPQGTPYALMQN